MENFESQHAEPKKSRCENKIWKKNILKTLKKRQNDAFNLKDSS